MQDWNSFWGGTEDVPRYFLRFFLCAKESVSKGKSTTGLGFFFVLVYPGSELFFPTLITLARERDFE